MKIIIADGKPVIQGMPAGNVVLFFAKISERQGYCVIFGPPETCLPSKDMRFAELFDAKIAFGIFDSEMEVVNVKHGHKYAKGGGMVEFKGDRQIFFRLPENWIFSTYEGKPVEKVYEVI
ncbi:MAG: hypothetical protein HGA61_02305 [Candidatus Moranbacteria bacterium]|nr:hypothetical protein [Candidatus Moranbacteria bacterium]